MIVKKNSNYKHIIWDWNGTLFDDVSLCVEVLNKLLEEEKLPLITYEYYKETFNFPVHEYYKTLGFSPKSYLTLADRFISLYEKGRLNCGLRESTKEAISFFNDKGLSQSILSACEQNYLEKIVGDFSLTSCFIKIQGTDDYYANGKIEIGKKHAADLNFKSGNILIIGDTIHDYEVAQEIGADSILVYSGHQSRKRLSSCKDALLVNSLNDLTDIFR